MTRFYLAHPIKIRHDIRDQELAFERATGIELVNPFFDGSEPRDQVTTVARSGWSNELSEEVEDLLVKNDLANIHKTDGVVAWVEKTVQSAGTFFEIWEAYREGKTVHIISPDWNNHPWLRHITRKTGGGIYHSFDELKAKFNDKNDKNDKPK